MLRYRHISVLLAAVLFPVLSAADPLAYVQADGRAVEVRSSTTPSVMRVASKTTPRVVSTSFPLGIVVEITDDERSSRSCTAHSSPSSASGAGQQAMHEFAAALPSLRLFQLYCVYRL